MAISGTTAHCAIRDAAKAVFMPRFSTVSSRCSPVPVGAKASISATTKSSGVLRIRAVSTAAPCARGSTLIDARSSTHAHGRALMDERSRANDQAHRVRGDALAATGGAEAFGGRRLDADGIAVDAEVQRDQAAHRVRVRADLRALADHGDVGVADAPTARAQQRIAVAQEGAAVGALPLRIRRREVAADVTQRRGAEHRVAQGVQDDVAIAVREHAAIEADPYAAEHQVLAIAEGVDVEAVADAHGAHRCDNSKAKRARSAGVVTLKLSSRPSTSSGRRPWRSMAIDSSVTSTPESRAD